MYTNDTIEERIHRILAGKQALFDEVIDDLSAETTMKTLTDEDLFSLFEMKPPEGGIGGTTARTPQQSAKTTLGQIRALSPAQFEQLVARYYEKLSFKVDIVGGPHDQGVDLFARRASDIGLERLAIQCKHYPDGQVGPSLIRELIGTWSSHPDATRVVMVTSGTISAEAVSLAERNRIDLIDGTLLRGIVEKYQISIKGGPEESK
jgi:restriction endonuclease Mrr